MESRSITIEIPDCDTAEQLWEFLRLADKKFLSDTTKTVIYDLQNELVRIIG